MGGGGGECGEKEEGERGGRPFVDKSYHFSFVVDTAVFRILDLDICKSDMISYCMIFIGIEP